MNEDTHPIIEFKRCSCGKLHYSIYKTCDSCRYSGKKTKEKYKEREREYAKNYAKAHVSESRQKQHRYAMRHPERMRERKKQEHLKYRERYQTVNKKWYKLTESYATQEIMRILNKNRICENINSPTHSKKVVLHHKGLNGDGERHWQILKQLKSGTVNPNEFAFLCQSCHTKLHAEIEKEHIKKYYDVNIVDAITKKYTQ